MYFVILLMLLVSHGINTQDSPIPPDIPVNGDSYVNLSPTTLSPKNNEPHVINRNETLTLNGSRTPWPANFKQTTASSMVDQPKVVNRIEVEVQMDLNLNPDSSKTPWPFNPHDYNNLNRSASSEVRATDSTKTSTTENDESEKITTKATTTSTTRTTTYKTTTRRTPTTTRRRPTTTRRRATTTRRRATTTQPRRKIEIEIHHATPPITTTPKPTEKKKKKNKFLNFLRGVKRFFVGPDRAPENPTYVVPLGYGRPSIGLVPAIRPAFRLPPPRPVFLPIRG